MSGKKKDLTPFNRTLKKLSNQLGFLEVETNYLKEFLQGLGLDDNLILLPHLEASDFESLDPDMIRTLQKRYFTSGQFKNTFKAEGKERD